MNIEEETFLWTTGFGRFMVSAAWAMIFTLAIFIRLIGLLTLHPCGQLLHASPEHKIQLLFSSLFLSHGSHLSCSFSGNHYSQKNHLQGSFSHHLLLLPLPLILRIVVYLFKQKYESHYLTSPVVFELTTCDHTRRERSFGVWFVVGSLISYETTRNFRLSKIENMQF